MATISERTWIWGHPKDSLANKYGLPAGNDATPVEGMKYLGAKNVFWVPQGSGRYDVIEESALMQKECKNFGWCVYRQADIQKIKDLHEKFPSYKICIYDDFFSDENRSNYQTISIEELLNLKKELNAIGMELWMVHYERFMQFDLTDWLPCFDGISFWFWYQSDEEAYIKTVEEFIARTPNKKRLLGCYLYDFGREKTCNPDIVEKELNLNTELMKQGLIEGIILHTNAVSGFGYEGYERAAKWMKENGNKEI